MMIRFDIEPCDKDAFSSGEEVNCFECDKNYFRCTVTCDDSRVTIIKKDDKKTMVCLKPAV